MVNIQPITFPIKGIATQLQVTVLPFSTDATTCGTYYALKTAEGITVTEGNYTLTEAEFTAWGQSNAYIENLIATHLGLTIINQ